MTELSSILPLCAYAVLGAAKSNAPGFWTALVPAIALAFGIWQFRVQRDKSKRPDVYFRNESERERKFLQRQASRRMQIGALIKKFKENSLKELDKAIQEDGNAAPENEAPKENSPN